MTATGTSSNSSSATPTSSTAFIEAVRHATADHIGWCPYLGDYSVVEEIVQGYFLGGLLERSVAVSSGQMTTTQACAENVAVCCYLARIFGGQAPEDYTSIGAWNDADGPGTLASLVRQRIAHCVAPQHLQGKESALQCLFSVVATDMFDAIHTFNDTGSEEKLLERINELTEDLTRLLLGLPQEF